MLRAISFGIPREDAVRAATYNPARQLGCLDEVGSIRDGKQADFVICDAELNPPVRSGWPEKSWPEKSNALRSRNASQGDFYATSSPLGVRMTTRSGISRPEAASAVSTAWVRPPQHGTCIRTTRTERMSFRRNSSVSFSL